MGEQRKLKGKHVDMLDAIAKKLGVDPSEAFGHVVGRAHEQMFGAEGQEGAPNMEAKDPANGGGLRKRSTGQESLDRIGEAHDGHVTEDSSNEIQDSPRARGGAPNPLAIKKWAGTKAEDDDEEEDEPTKKPVTQRKLGVPGKRPQK